MKIEKVKNCQKCPFVNNDNEYGYDGCNLIDIDLDKWEQMPGNNVHEKCYLKTNSVLVKLE